MEASKITYYNEISLMMFGFGDSHKPNPETVRLVESIVLKQLRTIVQEALKYTDGKNVKGKELIFLLRHNKYKMRRFIQFLRNKHLKSTVLAMNSAVIDLDQDSRPKGDIGDLLNFIDMIDETGEFMDLSEFDEVKHERLLRAARMSEALDEKKYLEFCKARSISFTSRDTMYRDPNKLRHWIDPKKDINFDSSAMLVLAYYAYQTVAEITDYALLVRMDSKCGTDPLNHLYGSYYTSAMFNGEHRLSGSNLDYSRVYSGQPPISVNEVKEVMRRVHSPQAGKLNFGGKIPDTHYLFAL